MTRYVCAILCTLIATSASAQNQYDEARLALLVDLVCAEGGRMDEATADRILPANGFTLREVREIVFELEDRELVTTTGSGVLVLTGGACNG